MERKTESKPQYNASLSIHALISTIDEFSRIVLAKLTEDEISNVAHTDPIVVRVRLH